MVTHSPLADADRMSADADRVPADTESPPDFVGMASAIAPEQGFVLKRVVAVFGGPPSVS